jgi:hypothetical protein
MSKKDEHNNALSNPLLTAAGSLDTDVLVAQSVTSEEGGGGGKKYTLVSLFSPSSAASQPIGPFIESVNSYSECIRNKTSEFIDLVKKLESAGELISRKHLIHLKLNDLEIWTLLMLTYTLHQDVEVLASQEVLGFLISVGIFVKKCKEALGIERDPKDYIHQVTDDLLDKLTPILPELFTKEDFAEFMGHTRPRSQSFLRLLELEKRVAISVSKKVSSLANMVFLPSLMKNLIYLSNYVEKKYLSPHKLPATYEGILNSIKLRQELEVDLEKESIVEYDATILTMGASIQKLMVEMHQKLSDAMECFSDEELSAAFAGDNPDEVYLRNAILAQCRADRIFAAAGENSSLSALLRRADQECETEEERLLLEDLNLGECAGGGGGKYRARNIL